jgi:hypothetical protein
LATVRTALFWYGQRGRQTHASSASGELFVIKRGHGIATSVAGMMQGIGQLQPGFTMGQRLDDARVILDRDLGQ